MSNTVNDIARALGSFYTDENPYENLTDDEKGVVLSNILEDICNNLKEIDILTEQKGIDVNYLLSIEGSYIVGMTEGTLNEETTPPSVLYSENLFPNLKDIELTKEEDTDGEQDSDTTDEGHGT